jgi:hypothetical protein
LINDLENISKKEEQKIERLERFAMEHSVGVNESSIGNTMQESESLSEEVKKDPPPVIEEKIKSFKENPKVPPSKDVAKPKPNVKKLWELSFDEEGIIYLLNF